MKFGKDKILQLSVIGFVALVLGIVARLAVVEVYHKDNTTANWTMFAVIGGFILLYYLFMEIYTPLAARFIRKKSENEIEENPVIETKEDPDPQVTQEQKSEPASLPITPTDKKPTVIDLKLESFESYSLQVMSQFVARDDLDRLMKYIGYYARRDKQIIPKKIHTSQVDTYDLLHFGWNMWNHFKVTKQPEVAIWLKSVFADLKDIDLSTIEHNLRHKEKGNNYLIKIQEMIE